MLVLKFKCGLLEGGPTTFAFVDFRLERPEWVKH